MSLQPGFWSLFCRASLRHWRLAPGATLVLVALLSLGVAAYVAMRLANRAAMTSFNRFAETLTGESDFVVRARLGDLAEADLQTLRSGLGTRPVHLVPMIEIPAAGPSPAGGRSDPTSGTRARRTHFTLLGLDLVALANLAPQGRGRPFFQSDAQTPGAGPSFWETLGEQPRVWISPAAGHDLRAPLRLMLQERVVDLPVAGAIPSVPEAPQPPANLLVMDLPQLQRLLGREGRIDRIEVILEPGPARAERRAELQQVLATLAGERWTVATPEDRAESAALMTQAFRLNLTVLSLLALLVGLYLVFQSLDGAVVRRRTEIATLRSLGVEERSISALWLLESALLGLLGGGLGVLLGWFAAQGAVRSVGATVDALYFSTTVRAAEPIPAEFVGGIALGIVASVVAGWWPARMAARVPPAQVLHRSAAPPGWKRRRRDLGIATALLLLGVLASRLPPWPLGGGGRFPLAGYLAAFCWIGGGGVFSALLLPLVGQLLPRRRASAAVVVCRGHVRSPTGRHRLAIAALHCAIGMTAGMMVLVASFDSTIRGWIGRSLQADLYVSSNAAQGASARSGISAIAAAEIGRHPAAEAFSTLRAHRIVVEGRETQLSAVDLSLVPARVELAWIEAPRDDAVLDPDRNEGLALVSEAFAARFDRGINDLVTLPNPGGPWTVRVAGIFADYGNDRGTIMVDQRHLQGRLPDDTVTNLSLWLKPGADAGAVRAELLQAYPGLSIFTNVRLRTEILRIFRQTFAITYALEVIGVAVAVAGLALTLASVLLDRRDELATLRSLGFTRGQIARATAFEGGAVAVAAVLGGLLLSFALGWLLIAVINKQSFGWTLGFAWPWRPLLLLAVTVVATGVGVSYLVGRWAAKLPADREE